MRRQRLNTSSTSEYPLPYRSMLTGPSYAEPLGPEDFAPESPLLAALGVPTPRRPLYQTRGGLGRGGASQENVLLGEPDEGYLRRAMG